MRSQKVVGIIMTYQCAHLLKDTFNNLPKKVFDEIIVVDDGSSDQVRQVAKKLSVKFFTHPHLGYGGNLKFGLKKAYELGADYMVEIHGDGQYNPKILPQALQKATGFDLLLGSRFQNLSQVLKDGMPIERFLANFIFSRIDYFLFQIPLTEFYNGFRIYSKKLIEIVPLSQTANDYFFSFQIIVQAKFYNLTIGEIPVRCDYKKDHTSENFWKAAFHSIETFQVFAQYLLAKLGFKTALFCKN